MCGIFAVINKTKKKLDENLCIDALNILKFRGPDDQSYIKIENKLFFGQTLLSVTGKLQKNSIIKQNSINNKYQLLFNGQIYNYKDLNRKFLSQLNINAEEESDSTILTNLHMFKNKEEIPQILRGMYAYIIYDKEANTISLVRDIQGEKSLYIYEDNENIIISSEIRAIKKFGIKLKLRNEIFQNYFNTRHLMVHDQTAFHNLRQISPGSLETLSLNNFYWKKLKKRNISDWINPKRLEENRKKNLDEITDEFEEILIRTIKEMTPQNHSYSSILSGGIDSTLISKYLHKYSNLNYFVAVNHVGKDTISSDLSRFKKIIGIDIDVINVNEKEYASRISACQNLCGSPLMSHSFIAQAIQCEKINAKGHKVIFGGEGGDELFGGYATYNQDLSKEFNISPSKYTTFQKTKMPFEFISDNYVDELKVLWKNSLNVYSHVENLEERNLCAMKYLDTKYQLPSVGLRGSDLMSMMWSVESRTVFVAEEIIKFALNLPKKHIISQINGKFETKAILKNLFLRHFPKELMYPKQGFSGFPNESKKYLGQGNKKKLQSFLNLHYLPESKDISEEEDWKMINIEYFLEKNLQY